MADFIFLENHSVYSMCEGTIFISELVSHAKSQGCSYLSICDTNGFYGIVNFIQACAQGGLKPLICVRLKNYSFNGILVARNMDGYSRICRLISEIHLNETFDVKNELLKTPPPALLCHHQGQGDTFTEEGGRFCRNKRFKKKLRRGLFIREDGRHRARPDLPGLLFKKTGPPCAHTPAGNPSK